MYFSPFLPLEASKWHFLGPIGFYFPLQRRRKLSNIGPVEKKFEPCLNREEIFFSDAIWGVQNIALRLAEIAFPRDIFRNICFHTADLFQNILNCGGVEKAYLSTEEEKYLQTCK